MPDTNIEEVKSVESTAPSMIRVAADYTTLMIKEWINSLLNQPTTPPFAFNADFRDELGRVVRLIIVVLTISGVIVGTANLFSKSVSLENVSGALTILIAGLLLTLVYTPFFYICGVRISFPPGQEPEAGKHRPMSIGQIFYSIVYTFVPWIPVSVFIRTSVVNTQSGALLDFLLLAPFLCLVYIVVNLVKSVKLITNSPTYRIWLAILSPLVILIPYFLFG